MKRIEYHNQAVSNGVDSRQRSGGGLVLYVEDNEDNWEVTRLALRRRFRLLWARSDREACELLARHGGDLVAVLMDIELQGSALDGIALTRLIRGTLAVEQVPPYAQQVPELSVPVLFITAYMGRYCEADLLAAGGCKLIAKPVDFAGLSLALSNVELGNQHSYGVQSPVARLSQQAPLLRRRVERVLASEPFRQAESPGVGTEAHAPSIAVALAAVDTLDGLDNVELLLAAALRRAAAALLLGRHICHDQLLQCFIVGLMLEFGLLARARHDREGALESVTSPAASRTVREDAAGEVNHARRGAEIAREWCLPESVVAAVQGHHDVTMPTERLAAVGWAAERLSAVYEPGDVEVHWRIACQAAAAVGLSEQQIEAVLRTIPDQVLQLADALEVDVGHQPSLEDLHEDDRAQLTQLGRAYDTLVELLTSVVAEKNQALVHAGKHREAAVQRADQLAEANRLLKVEMARRHTMQSRLQVADRLAAVGVLAAGVAHEINNPLAYVMGNLDSIASDIGKVAHLLPAGAVSELKEAVGDCKHGAERVRVITQDLMTFARPRCAEGTPVELQNVMDLATRMASNVLKHRVRVIKDYQQVQAVAGSAERLGQVFLNLLLNAAQAMSEDAARDNEIRVIIRQPAPDRVVIEVVDNGEGMPPEVLARIFDPFFTTKAIGVGTGLGLSICRNIVQSCGGDIEIESTVGVGTRARVWLPVGQPATGATAEPSGAGTVEAAGVAGVHTLIVDDEPRVARALSRMLDSHQTTIVSSASEALQVCVRQDFDLVLCDLMMPEMNGAGFLSELSRARPELVPRVVLMTGGACSAEAESFLSSVANPVLNKPFDRQALRGVLSQVLDDHPAS